MDVVPSLRQNPKTDKICKQEENSKRAIAHHVKCVLKKTLILYLF